MVPVGKTTFEAVKHLRDELETLLTTHEQNIKTSRNHLTFLERGISHSVLHWTNVFVTVLLALLLFISYFLLPTECLWLLIESLILVICLVSSLFVEWREQVMRRYEVHRRLRTTLSSFAEFSRYESWHAESYIDIHSPFSPCVALQWTLRDGEVVNLPAALLITGDVILVRPGQIVHARCKSLQETGDKEMAELNAGDTYDIYDGGGSSVSGNVQAMDPLKPRHFVVLESPVVECVRLVLTQWSEKPDTDIFNERYLVYDYFIERYIIPAMLVLCLAVNSIRYALLQHAEHWAQLMLVNQIHAALPLSMLLLPLLIRGLDVFGTANLMVVLETVRKHGLNHEYGAISHTSRSAYFKELLSNMRRIVLGRSSALVRSTCLVHVLGSLTSLCCVDKKGILSWPNPTPEKVSFLRRIGSEQTRCADETSTRSFVMETVPEISTTEVLGETFLEVLDLTQDCKNGYLVEFDDPGWKRYINSLKPLGLNILLNACNMDTCDQYTQFSDHVSTAMLDSDVAVPVLNRRCFCELSRQIGFRPQAKDIFTTTNTLGVYRHMMHVHNDSSLASYKYKVPIPHMFSVVAKDTQSTGCQQLMSHGTADCLLELCSEYWDGQELHNLTSSDRKKLLDFYYRTSLSSYCTAFSYRPLTEHIGSELENMYAELRGRSQEEPCRMSGASPNLLLKRQSLDGSLRNCRLHSSADSLMLGGSMESVHDIETCVDAQRKQIFIGAVSMQYQAKQDIVELIEDLEAACIRFVHFSKENELRSRVFSEKMGLEAGWNCHISLSTERRRSHRPRSATAASRCSAARAQPDTADIRRRRDSAPGEVPTSSPMARDLEMTDDIIKDGYHGMTEVMDIQADVTSPLLNCGASETDSAVGAASDQSLPRYSRATNSTDSVTGGLELSNRARLPRGIHNIRPHIESVDNVPLLVSLFTDCTPETTTEMMKILQENGEVVCVLGSSATLDNTSIFLQADCSLAVEPTYPQICVRQPPVRRPWDNNVPSPMNLAALLVSLPCALSFKRDDPISVIALVGKARQYCQLFRKTFLLYLMFMLSISLLGLLSAAALLPAPLGAGHMVWLLFVAVPLLSLTMMAGPSDPNIMKIALGKNKGSLTKETVREFIFTYCIRCVPSLVIVVVTHGLSVNSICYMLRSRDNSTCGLLVPKWSEDGLSDSRLFLEGLSVSQDLSCFQLVIYLVVISLCFINRYHHLWQKVPFGNVFWSCATLFLLFVHSMYLVGKTSTANSPVSLADIPVVSWILVFVWPIINIPVQEAVKHAEILKYNRYQKRARLDFDTKLGMNSPF